MVRAALLPTRAASTTAVRGEVLTLLNTLKAMEPTATDVIATQGALEVAVKAPEQALQASVAGTEGE